MNIFIYAAACCLDPGEATQRSAVSVSLTSSDDFGNVSTRVISHPIDRADKKLADIISVCFALLSVKERHRKGSSVFLFIPEYIKKYLNEASKEDTEENTEEHILIQRIKNCASGFSKLKIMEDIDSNNYAKCLEAARHSAKLQRPKDTRTQKA